MTILGLTIGWTAIAFAGGLVCGWFFLPVPGFVKRIFGR